MACLLPTYDIATGSQLDQVAASIGFKRVQLTDEHFREVMLAWADASRMAGVSRHEHLIHVIGDVPDMGEPVCAPVTITKSCYNCDHGNGPTGFNMWNMLCIVCDGSLEVKVEAKPEMVKSSSEPTEGHIPGEPSAAERLNSYFKSFYWQEP